MPTDIDRTLDWRPSTDERNADYPIRAFIGDQVPRRTKLWRAAIKRLDQGAEGACVGFGWTNELMALPVSVYIADPDSFARSAYHEAQLIDEYGDTPPEGGTSVNAGAKIMRQRGYIGEWRWADGIDDVIDTLCSPDGGCVVIGIPWSRSYFQPRPSGLLERDGDSAGGHCVCLTGYYTKHRLYGETESLELIRGRQSWGPDWGDRGSMYWRPEDLEADLDHGEAAVPTIRIDD